MSRPHGSLTTRQAQAMRQAKQFVLAVEPMLQRNDLHALVEYLKATYDPTAICQILSGGDPDARKVAALCLGLVGCRKCIDCLTAALADPDPVINQMVEHALWSIWFRGGNPSANCHLAHGTEALNNRDVEEALRHFNRAIELCPDFAEAYNQRAIVRYLSEDFEGSLADGRKVVELMPCHFGAWAGMGHCHAHRGEFHLALVAYRRALSINPHLECVRELIDELHQQAVRQCLCETEDLPEVDDDESTA